MKRLIGRRPSAAMVVACLSLLMAMGGVGYAAATIDSGDIVNNTVRSRDVLNRALTSKDIRKESLGGGVIKESKLEEVPRASAADDADALGGTPAGGYLQAGARGVALAGARIDDSGAVLSWFNRAGGAPTVSGGGDNNGDYNVQFPGLEIASATHLAQATVVGVFGLATVDYSGGKVHMRTFHGNLAMDTFDAKDRDFALVVYGSSTTG
ncbi:MAG TPA: hypothetical protein VK307_00895 [Thermoleophilaceae bacterium]|nr:hypothetical protein [Thermoleophilaceae bacterium]